MEFFGIQSHLGEKKFAYVDLFEYPHGNIERLPVAIIRGKENGPLFLLSANIHGNELHGLVALQEVIQELDPLKMKGCVIVLPTLNPAGLLTLKRSPFYTNSDPNRLWLDPKPKKEPIINYEDPYDKLLDPKNFPEIQEQVYSTISEIFKEVDYYIDLHCHFIQSVPFSYIDRVYYKEDDEKSQIESAKQLFDYNLAMVKLFNLPVVVEDSPRHYFRQDLHRSTTGSFVNGFRKPAFTVELGGSGIVKRDLIKIAKKGILNVLGWAKIIELEPKREPLIPDLDEKLWQEIPIRSTTSGLFIPLVKEGKLVEKGEPIIEIRNIFGETKEIIKAPEDGAVLAFYDDIGCYPNSELASFIVENKVILICPWNYDEKKEEKEKQDEH